MILPHNSVLRPPSTSLCKYLVPQPAATSHQQPKQSASVERLLTLYLLRQSHCQHEEVSSVGRSNLVMTIAGGTTAAYTVVYNSPATGNVTVAGYTSGTNIPVSPGATTTYSLISVTDANGCTATAVSGTPTVTVQNPPAITTQPVSRVICEDATTTFTVAATGTTLTYQWQRDPNTGTYTDITDGATDGASVYTNATTATLSVNTSGTGLTLNNYKYRVVITGVCPTPVTSATPRSLTIQPKA